MIDQPDGRSVPDGYEESDERGSRRRHFDAAISSVALEGLTVPDSYKSEAERFIRGEIDFDMLTSKVHELARIR